ncbi:MAG: hypothetical protein JRC60_07185 [Deltaproteobacteria bacterium]|nr:hypothetical protein [Deltaproteobacteria bacterium]
MEEESRKKKKEEMPAAGWEIIYCSLVLILVAFFVMLVSYSSIEKERIKQFRQERELISENGKPGSDILNFSPDISEAQGEFVMQTMKALKIYLTQAGLDKSVSMEKVEKGFKVTFGSNVLFPSGKAEINKDASSCLDEMIKIALNSLRRENFPRIGWPQSGSANIIR